MNIEFMKAAISRLQDENARAEAIVQLSDAVEAAHAEITESTKRTTDLERQINELRDMNARLALRVTNPLEQPAAEKTEADEEAESKAFFENLGIGR